MAISMGCPCKREPDNFTDPVNSTTCTDTICSLC